MSLFVSSVLLFCFLLSAFVFCFAWSSFFFFVCYRRLFFALLVFLVAEGVGLSFRFCLYSTPLARRASLQSANNCAFSCVFPFLLSCFLLLPCLTWTFFSLFPFGCVIFSILISRFDFSTSSYYFHPVYLFLGSMWSSRFLWRLVQRTACI